MVSLVPIDLLLIIVLSRSSLLYVVLLPGFIAARAKDRRLHATDTRHYYNFMSDVSHSLIEPVLVDCSRKPGGEINTSILIKNNSNNIIIT